MTFYKRVAAVDVELKSSEILRIKDLRISFEIKKTNKSNANTAKIEITNLSQNTRSKLREFDALCRLSAGYEDEGGATLLFVGYSQHILNKRQPPDIVTQIEAQDGIRNLREGRVNISYAAGTSAQSIVNRLTQELNYPVRQNVNVVGNFSGGYIFNGRAKDAMDEVLSRFDFQWGIVNNEIQIFPRGSSIDDVAVLLSPQTGLVNAPERCNHKNGQLEKAEKDEPEWKLTSLLNPRLNPGGLVDVRSKDITGVFKIDTVRHYGDTRGNEWYSEIEVRTR